MATDAVSGLYEQGVRELEHVDVSIQDTAGIISWLQEVGEPYALPKIKV